MFSQPLAIAPPSCLLCIPPLTSPPLHPILCLTPRLSFSNWCLRLSNTDPYLQFPPASQTTPSTLPTSPAHAGFRATHAFSAPFKPTSPTCLLAVQVELHPLLAQRKLVGVCLRKGVHCVAYSPLGISSTELLEHPAVTQAAQETGKTPAQVSWAEGDGEGR